MTTPTRTHTCGELGLQHDGCDVVLNGWVASKRDLGGLTFIHLRDRFGSVQVVLSDLPELGGDRTPADIRPESVLSVRGAVRARPEAQRKGDGTGAIEVDAAAWQQLAACEPLPFDLSMRTPSREETRLAHRYLDLRRPELMDKLVLRHRALQLCRRHLDTEGFLEVETPILTRSTPEGARDFLVPSRIHDGDFYALPQSPQLFKQLLMVAGADRYMQVVRCFRDEDLRADRQPEFTQIDLELSFVQADDVMAMAERLMAALWHEVLGVELKTPFRRLPYAEALQRWGCDKPDLRFGMELADLAAAGEIRFDFLTDSLSGGGVLKGMVLPQGASMSRKQIDAVVDRGRQLGLGGLLWGKVTASGWTGPAAKGFGDDFKAAVAETLGAADGDLFLAATGDASVVNTALDRLRRELADQRDMIPADAFDFCWVVDFPLLDYDEDQDRHVATHHPFTAPVDEDLDRLEDEPGAVRARAYDLVCNGVELGGGSIRIHTPDLQQRMFRALGIGADEAAEKFGFLLEALTFGAPPHGGIAFGFDRLVAMLAGTEAIRDVIAFPKTTSASCLMTQAPSSVDQAQLDELHLELKGR
jgi:aspartyl-tRNA synthetase